MTQLVYVYATDSYTETTIKDFLRKINPQIRWVVRSPYLRKMPKKDYLSSGILPVLTGRTGADLEVFMIEEIKEHLSILSECDAIVLEDDLDQRDSKEDQNEYLHKQQARLNATISGLSKTCKTRLICMYAAPEIETWLIEDWANSFGDTRLFDQQIATELRKSLNKMRDECGGNFECYSHHFTEKFSDWIVSKIQQLSIEFDIVNPDKASYSKMNHGAKFLRAIEPQRIESKCRVYFSDAYHAIKAI